MPIEFDCPHCDEMLRTPDDTAGRTATCPSCREPVVVPDPGDEFIETSDLEPEWEIDDDFPHRDDFPRHEVQDSRVEPHAEARPCPTCGEWNPAALAECPACGKSLRPAVRSTEFVRVPIPLDLSRVISQTWDIYRSNLRLFLGGALLDLVLIAGVGLGAVLLFAGFAAFGALLQGFPVLQGVLTFLGAFAAIVFGVYTLLHLQVGRTILLLKLARGKEATFRDLYAGGRFVPRLFINKLFFGILQVVGFMCCFVPGIVVTLLFWSHPFVLIDRDTPGLTSMALAKQVSEKNIGSVVVLSLLAGLLTFIGMMTAVLGLVLPAPISELTASIGLFFTTPFVALMFTVAYVQMSDQLFAEPAIGMDFDS